MPPINRLITRGMGPAGGIPGRPGMITVGYGGLIGVIVEAVSAVIQGGAKAIRRLPEIFWIVRARLEEVNAVRILRSITGMDHLIIDPNRPEPQIDAVLDSNSVNKPSTDIVITAARVRSGRKRGY